MKTRSLLVVSMFNVIMVHTDGSLTEKTATDIEKLYTVCQFRNDTHFTCLTTWSKNGAQYQLYGKPKNKNTKLNNYLFPFTQEQYYGNLCIVKRIDEYENMTIQEWNQCMNIEPFVQTDTIEVPGELTKEDYEEE